MSKKDDEISAGSFYCPYVPLISSGEPVEKSIIRQAVEEIENEKGIETERVSLITRYQRAQAQGANGVEEGYGTIRSEVEDSDTTARRPIDGDSRVEKEGGEAGNQGGSDTD